MNITIPLLCYVMECNVVVVNAFQYSRIALAIFRQNLFATEVGVSPAMAALGSSLTRGTKTVLVGS